MAIDEHDPSPMIDPTLREKERMIWAENFVANWKAPRLLSKPQKDNIKKYLSIMQGRDGTRVLCCFCNKEFGTPDAEVHHKDHDRTHNKLEDLEASCRPCNQADKAVWMKQMASCIKKGGSVISQKKENEAEDATAAKRLEEQAMAAIPTTRMKLRYTSTVLAYLTVYVTEPREFDSCVADVEAITNCSHQKAIEYLNARSLSPFAGWRQYTVNGTTSIAPRKGETGQSNAYARALAEADPKLIAEVKEWK